MPVADLALSGEQAIVIGTGGAARAILFALSRCDIGDVTILARNPLAGAALLARFGLKGSVKAIGASLPDAALLVNTTSLGMAGQPPLVIDVDALSDRCVVYDIVYTPLITPLMAAGQKRGLEVIGGLDMLIGQARIAFEIFFDAVPPDDDNELLELLCA